MKDYLKISHYLQIFFKLLSITVLLFIILAWWFIDKGTIPNSLGLCFSYSKIVTHNGTVDLLTMQHSITSKLIGFVGSLIGGVPYIFAYYTLHKLFANYAKGKIFISENVIIYQSLGRILFINGLVCIPLYDALMVLTATINNAAGQRTLTLGFGTPNIEAILSGFVVMVIAWVMSQANDLSHEQQLTV
jgi:hypothetical protein